RTDKVSDALRDRSALIAWKRAVEVHAVVGRIAHAGIERRHVQGWNQNDAAANPFRLNFAEQMFNGDGTFVLIAMRGADRDQAAPGRLLTPGDDRHRNQVIAPVSGMLKANEVVASAGRSEID